MNCSTPPANSLAGGNRIVDRPKIIDIYPAQGTLANILQETSSNEFCVFAAAACEWNDFLIVVVTEDPVSMSPIPLKKRDMLAFHWASCPHFLMKSRCHAYIEFSCRNS